MVGLTVFSDFAEADDGLDLRVSVPGSAEASDAPDCLASVVDMFWQAAGFAAHGAVRVELLLID
mgnify:CR=1 FL=1